MVTGLIFRRLQPRHIVGHLYLRRPQQNRYACVLTQGSLILLPCLLDSKLLERLPHLRFHLSERPVDAVLSDAEGLHFAFGRSAPSSPPPP